MDRFLWICLGGALGTGARFALASWCQQRWGTWFPCGTFAVNLIGSFLLGMIMHVGMNSDVLSPTLRMTLGTGVMGGFTTYSTFNYDTLRFVQNRTFLLGIINVLVTLVGCLVAGFLGVAIAKRIIGA